jgi:uncharacterized membrane protein
MALQTGLKKETAGALSYFLGPVTGILFLILEKDSFVRFHAMQSIVVFGALFVLNMVLTFTIIFAVLVPVIWIVGFVLWLMLMYKALQGQEWEVPYLGKIAKQLLPKV